MSLAHHVRYWDISLVTSLVLYLPLSWKLCFFPSRHASPGSFLLPCSLSHLWLDFVLTLNLSITVTSASIFPSLFWQRRLLPGFNSLHIPSPGQCSLRYKGLIVRSHVSSSTNGDLSSAHLSVLVPAPSKPAWVTTSLTLNFIILSFPLEISLPSNYLQFFLHLIVCSSICALWTFNKYEILCLLPMLMAFII